MLMWQCCRIIPQGKEASHSIKDSTSANGLSLESEQAAWTLYCGNSSQVFGHQTQTRLSIHFTARDIVINEPQPKAPMGQSILTTDKTLLPFTVNTHTLSLMVKCCHLTSATWDPIFASKIREFVSVAVSCMVIHFPQRKATTDLSNVLFNALVFLSHYSSMP